MLSFSIIRVEWCLALPAAARSKACVYGGSLAGVSKPTGAWSSVSCECYVLSGRYLYDGLITLPEESY